MYSIYLYIFRILIPGHRDQHTWSGVPWCGTGFLFEGQSMGFTGVFLGSNEDLMVFSGIFWVQ